MHVHTYQLKSWQVCSGPYAWSYGHHWHSLKKRVVGWLQPIGNPTIFLPSALH